MTFKNEKATEINCQPVCILPAEIDELQAL